eukprot:161216-Amphidinium_carterae.1
MMVPPVETHAANAAAGNTMGDSPRLGGVRLLRIMKLNYMMVSYLSVQFTTLRKWFGKVLRCFISLLPDLTEINGARALQHDNAFMAIAFPNGNQLALPPLPLGAGSSA